MFNSCLNSVVVATSVQCAVATTTAATTTPAKGYTEVFVFLVDATVVQNAVASAAVAFSPTSAFHFAPISTLSDADVDDAGLKG